MKLFIVRSAWEISISKSGFFCRFLASCAGRFCTIRAAPVRGPFGKGLLGAATEYFALSHFFPIHLPWNTLFEWFYLTTCSWCAERSFKVGDAREQERVHPRHMGGRVCVVRQKIRATGACSGAEIIARTVWHAAATGLRHGHSCPRGVRNCALRNHFNFCFCYFSNFSFYYPFLSSIFHFISSYRLILSSDSMI